MHTVADVTHVCNCRPSQVLKSLFFTHKEIKVLALLPGNLKVDKAKLAQLADVQTLKMASPEEVKKYTGYEIGSVSPFGIDNDILKIMDTNVLNEDKVLIGTGKKRELFELETESLKCIWDGLVKEIGIKNS